MMRPDCGFKNPDDVVNKELSLRVGTREKIFVVRII